MCVGDDLFRCQASLWTKQTCGHGCLTEQADCLRFTHIGAGNPFTCVRRTDGTVWCWGGNSFELMPDLPLGILGQPVDQLGLSDKPVHIAALSGVKQLVAGRLHACALLEQGQVRCWGNNATHRQLGRSKSTVYSWEPQPVPGLPDTIEELFAGDISTCARDKSGDFYCWGVRIDGKVGGETSWYEDGAVAQPQLKGFAQISVGAHHACGLRPEGLRCWGYNGGGQLALGATDEVPHPDPTPAQVPSLPWAGAHASGDISFAWTKNEFYGWGPNSQLAFGLSDMGILPPTNLKPFWKFFTAQTFVVKQVSVGFGFSCVLIEEDGVRHVRCAGLNDAFQCGGEETYQPDPRDIGEGKKILKTEAIAAGWRHACAIELGGESVKCWGIAHGNGTDIDTPTPVEVLWSP